MLDERRSRRRITLGADKAYDVFDFVQDLKERTSRRTLPSTAQSVGPASHAKPPSTGAPPAIPAIRSASAAASGSRRYSAGYKRSAGSPAQGPGHREGEAAFILALAAYNLIRLPKLLAAPP